ncbi:MAG: DUF2085 domain-containing protein [Anaerolineae bacterium]|nr:DUF2085 domain-containing protein [Anaerolineae bacterium]
MHTHTYDAQQLRKVIRSNRWVLRLSRNWLKVVLGFLFLYTGLSVLPPFLMQAGLEGPANAIHTIYGPMCHQFSFRSWFFFGDQVAYPREVSGTSMGTFEEYAARDPYFENVDLHTWNPDLQIRARKFRGNEEMGYKTALCERDVAIYATMFLMGLLFARVRRWLRPAPLWLYLVLGLIPLGLDGFSQMFGYPPFEFWPIRETLPAYRALTGALFGLMNVWLAFPYLEESMNETMAAVGEKLTRTEALLAEMEADH